MKREKPGLHGNSTGKGEEGATMTDSFHLEPSLPTATQPEVCTSGASYLVVGDVSGASDGVIFLELCRVWPVKEKLIYQLQG